MNLKQKIAEKARPIEQALAKYLRIREPEKLYKATAHIPLAGGKRLRPVMALITCEMVGGDSEKAIPFAASLEAIHNFTLVHDDVMDNDELRHGVAACHTVYGLSTAILAGDTLFAYAFEMIADCDIKPKIKADLVKNVAHVVRKIAEGQQLDINFEDDPEVKSEQYMEMIKLKTSILFGTAAYGGALIGGAPEEEARILEDMATNVGLGFQIWDDYLDATASESVLGKPAGSDIRQGKKTLLVIEALNRAEEREKIRLKDIIEKKNNTDEEIAEAVNIMEECGALTASRNLANSYLKGVKKVLSSYPNDEPKQLFEELLEYMVKRGH